MNVPNIDKDLFFTPAINKLNSKRKVFILGYDVF